MTKESTSHGEEHGAGHSSTHNLSQADIEHLKNAVLIEKYSHVYNEHQTDLFYKKIWHMIVPHHHHEAIIPTDNIKSPEFAELSESQKVDRSVYALWKISQVNHHFFPPSEQRILANEPMGILRFFYLYSVTGGLLAWMGHSFLNNRLTLVRAGVAVTVYAAMRASLFGIEVSYDKLKSFSRRRLARKYIDVYGANKLFDISKPSYPVEKLEHMHNKLHTV